MICSSSAACQLARNIFETMTEMLKAGYEPAVAKLQGGGQQANTLKLLLSHYYLSACHSKARDRLGQTGKCSSVSSLRAINLDSAKQSHLLCSGSIFAGS